MREIARYTLYLSGIVLLVAAGTGAAALGGFGSQVQLGEDDQTSVLVDAGAFAAVCFVDDDGSADYSPGEAVYATTASCAGSVMGNDLRLTPAGGQPAGTQVRASHADFGNPYSDPGASIEVYDADGDGAYSAGDHVYGDMDGGGDAVAVGDIRLTRVGAFAAGSAVAAGNPDLNNAFSGSPPELAVTAWDFLDADGDGAWTRGDVAYAEGDADDNYASAVDLRLGSFLGVAFGAQVAVGDVDTTYTLNDASDLTTLCFVDDDASGAYDAGEPVYATSTACTDPATTELSGNDLRITPAAGQAAGTQVRATHLDFGNPATLLGDACLDFFDGDGDSGYSGGDVVYLNVDCADATVSAGDVRFTPIGSFAAGTSVAPGDSDVNNALCVAPGACASVPDGMSGAAGGNDPAAWDFLDIDGDGVWTSGDVAYLDADADNLASSVDVRLGSVGGEPFGGQVAAGDADLVYSLEDSLPFSAICFVDDDGSGTYNPGEPVYATTASCAGAVTGNDLRLTPTAGHGVGTQVRATDNDFGNPYADPGASVEFYDADGDALYSLGDQVYLDMDGGSDAVAVGDVRLSPQGSHAGGSVVATGDADINNAFDGASPGGQGEVADWRFFDADGDTVWSSGDTAYVNADDNSLVTAGDVRLGPTAEVSGDTTPPEITLSLDGVLGGGGWWRSDVAVTVTATDAGSGVASLEVAVDGGAFEATSSVVVEGDGVHTLLVRATDAAGNVAFANETVPIDTTAPAAIFVQPEPGVVYVAGLGVPVGLLEDPLIVGDLDVIVDGADAGSGVAEIVFFVDGVERGRAPGPGPATFPWAAGSEAAGPHALALRAVDVAGNEGSVAFEVVTIPTTLEGLAATNVCTLVFSPFVCALLPGQGAAPALASRPT
ncbi:MAG TPA: hypothetical protein VGR28_09630 [Candidatus Thermoplasmatota archaeon]|nr:hypothetical protein [Candidatus Thermoplasmatota archaeon]